MFFVNRHYRAGHMRLFSSPTIYWTDSFILRIPRGCFGQSLATMNDPSKRGGNLQSIHREQRYLLPFCDGIDMSLVNDSPEEAWLKIENWHSLYARARNQFAVIKLCKSNEAW